ncbi:MAG: MFS transporter [Planctomycetes bacterium]|nr:MFS transporter [Planctomycetota bacterium]
MNGVTTRLSVMMFIQFFVWGAWFATLGQALGAAGMAEKFGGGSYGSAPIAAIIAPLFLGLIADRLFSSERVMGVLFLIGGVLMYLAYGYAKAGDGEMMVWLFIGHMLCYMPTLGLSNTIAFTNITDQNDFPKIRVWGTIGWIAAGLVVGFAGWSSDFKILILAAASSLVLGVYSFTLPHTPPPARGKPFDIRALLMVDALKLLAKPAFFVFIACSTLICIPLAYYYGLTSNYLHNTGFVAPASTMTIGQMSEIIFMLLIPFFFRRLGVKYMILLGMLAWVIRYGLYALAAPDQVIWMIYIAVALHGVCYDFFFVTGFMYTDKVAAKDIRGQAQSMLVFFTQGVGMYFGYWVCFAKLGTVEKYGELTAAIDKARPPVDETFVQSMMNMFKVSDLKALGISPDLISTAMKQWAEFWWLPAGMAGVIAVIFFIGFWDKMSNYDKTDASNTESMNNALAAEELP